MDLFTRITQKTGPITAEIWEKVVDNKLKEILNSLHPASRLRVEIAEVLQGRQLVHIIKEAGRIRRKEHAPLYFALEEAYKKFDAVHRLHEAFAMCKKLRMQFGRYASKEVPAQIKREQEEAQRQLSEFFFSESLFE